MLTTRPTEQQPAHMTGSLEGLASDLARLIRYDPTDYEYHHRPSLAEVPERELAAAVMLRAVEDMRQLVAWVGGRGANGRALFRQSILGNSPAAPASDEPRVRRWYMKTRAWFLSTDESWPYSFERLCAYLRLDPDGIRREIRRQAPPVSIGMAPRHRPGPPPREIAARLWRWAEGRDGWTCAEAGIALGESHRELGRIVRHWAKTGRAERVAKGLYRTVGELERRRA